MRKTIACFGLLSACLVGGCEKDSAEKIARLQDQIQGLTQQLNETKKQVDGLQEANQRSVQAIENLDAAVGRLNTAFPAPAAPRAASAIAAKSENAAKGSPAIPAAPATAEAPAPTSNKKPPIVLAEQDIPSSPQPGRPMEVFVSKVAPGGDREPSERADAPQDPHDSPKKFGSSVSGGSVSCGQVWKQLGQGKSPEAAARALGVSVSVIHACEQKVGSSKTGR